MIEASRPRLLSRKQLVEMLSESLGDDKARQVIGDTVARLGFGGLEYDREQVLAILEAMTEEPGLVGVVARFAKARAILALR